VDTDPISAEDTGNESSYLPDLETKDEEVLEQEGVTGEEEELEEGREMRREMRKMS
jgi:hypothetical protein